MRDTDRRRRTSGTCKTKRTGVFGRTNTDIAISSGHLGQRPLLLGGGGVVPFAKQDDCNTEANDSAISFARMSESYLRQKKVSQLTRVTEENDDAGVAGRVRNRAGNQRVSPLGRTPAYGDTLNSAPRPSCRRPPGTLRTEQFQLRQQSPHAPPRNNIPRFHAQKNSGRMKRKYQKRQPTA